MWDVLHTSREPALRPPVWPASCHGRGKSIQPASVLRANISPCVEPLSWTRALSATSAVSQASVAARP